MRAREGRAIEPNGGHRMKTPGADKRHGFASLCRQQRSVGVLFP